MPKVYKISKGGEYIIVTVDDGGAYIIKDMSGKKVFFSKKQAELMKFGIESLLKSSSINSEDQKDVEVQEIEM